jgi:hypothetical protein
LIPRIFTANFVLHSFRFYRYVTLPHLPIPFFAPYLHYVDLAGKETENFLSRTHKFPSEFISSSKMAPVALLEGSLFDFTLTHPDSKPWALSDLKGSAKAVLLVNTASECGYTPQFGPLGELHNEYKDRGLVVVGVPSNDFGSQEPLASDKIPEFCAKNFGATFPLSGKVSNN